MRIAILSNQTHSFIRLQAEGLARMCSRIGVDVRIFTDGLRMLEQRAWRGSLRRRSWIFAAKALFWPAAARLAPYDVVVIVLNLPNAFMKDYSGIEQIRKIFPRKPLVLYSHYYLGTRDPKWLRWLRKGGGPQEYGLDQGGHFGAERYDWYLSASLVNKYPLPPGEPPCSLIGLDLDDGTLFPENKKDLIALIDFERVNYMSERAVQIEALEATGTKYIVLNGRYTIPEIRSIYRRCGLYFLAHQESFGLPICELQACGSYVFTPYSTWCPSHWLKKDLRTPGAGEHSPNIIAYDNDREKLIAEIRRVRSAYDPMAVVETFKRYHPQLFFGDVNELRRFVDKVRDGEITGRSHEKYSEIEPISLPHKDAAVRAQAARRGNEAARLR